jgi:hypothetical protein
MSKKIFLARFTIMDGEHEHTAYGLIKAENLEKAIEYAESQEHETSFFNNKDTKPAYFDYGDGTTASKCESVVELTQNQVDVIGELGVAFYMN